MRVWPKPLAPGLTRPEGSIVAHEGVGELALVRGWGVAAGLGSRLPHVWEVVGGVAMFCGGSRHERLRGAFWASGWRCNMRGLRHGVVQMSAMEVCYAACGHACMHPCFRIYIT